MFLLLLITIMKRVVVLLSFNMLFKLVSCKIFKFINLLSPDFQQSYYWALTDKFILGIVNMC